MNPSCRCDEAVPEADDAGSIDAALRCQLEQWLECVESTRQNENPVQSFDDTLELGTTCVHDQHDAASASRQKRRRATEMRRLVRFGWTRVEVMNNNGKKKRYVYTNQHGLKHTSLKTATKACAQQEYANGLMRTLVEWAVSE